MGPQHPSTHGVLRVVLRLDGEKVVDADVVIGYLHRGIEKLSENRNWTQIILLTDRMDYVAAATNNVGYCETVEKLMSLEVPRRARYVRTILCELQRIASHCLWLGTHAMDIGAMTVFLYAFRERELILDLFEEFCGARLTYNSMRIGGLPLDIPPGWDKKVLEFCKIMDVEDRRVRGAADAQPHLARADQGRRRDLRRRRRSALGLSGPPLRGSGVAARRPQGRAVRGVRRDGVRRADRHRRRHLRSLSGAASRSSGSRCGSSGRRPKGFPKGRSSARCRGSSSRRPARPITPSSRRRASSATSSSATASRPTRTASACGRRRSATCRRCARLVTRPSGRRRRRADRLARRRARRGRSVIDNFVIPLLKIVDRAERDARRRSPTWCCSSAR